MRDAVGQLLQLGLALLQVGGHQVDRPADQGQLVGAPQPGPRRQVAPTELHRGVPQLVRTPEPQQMQQQSEQAHAQQRQQQLLLQVGAGLGLPHGQRMADVDTHQQQTRRLDADRAEQQSRLPGPVGGAQPQLGRPRLLQRHQGVTLGRWQRDQHRREAPPDLGTRECGSDAPILFDQPGLHQPFVQRQAGHQPARLSHVALAGRQRQPALLEGQPLAQALLLGLQHAGIEFADTQAMAQQADRQRKEQHQHRQQQPGRPAQQPAAASRRFHGLLLLAVHG